VDRHLDFIVGDPESGDNGNSFVSMSVPLDYNVSDKIKNQIWTNQYIDMAGIAEPDVPGEFSIKLIPGATGGQLKITPSKPPKTSTTVGQWCSTFNIFIAVYCERFPAQTKPLLPREGQEAGCKGG
jgi:hypothetical protein